MQIVACLARVSLTNWKYYGLPVLRNTPTTLQWEVDLRVDDYGKKASIKRACNKKGRAEMTLPSKGVLVG
jgi:hypothetical protein